MSAFRDKIMPLGIIWFTLVNAVFATRKPSIKCFLEEKKMEGKKEGRTVWKGWRRGRGQSPKWRNAAWKRSKSGILHLDLMYLEKEEELHEVMAQHEKETEFTFLATDTADAAGWVANITL